MQSRTPARPAPPWARSMALAVRRERRPRIGVSRPTKAARAIKPAETFPKSPAGKPSLSDVPFNRTTITSRAPRPSSRCNPINTGLRMPRRCKTASARPSAMAPRGRRTNGNIGMSAPDRKSELRNSVQNRPEGFVFAMAGDGDTVWRRHNFNPVMTRAGLPELCFCRKFEPDFWLARKRTAKVNKPIFAALGFNTNRQARTS